jgi:prophage antirepressor-like protein
VTLSLSLTFDGQTVRMVGSPDAPEWVAADVCNVLEIVGVGRACARIPTAEKGVRLTQTPGGPQQMATVKLPGLLRLILRSRKPEALRFQAWAVNEVLPSVLRHGCYPPPAAVVRHAVDPLYVPDLDDPRSLRGLCLALAERRALDQQEIAILRPKAELHDRLTAAGGDVSLMDCGRILGWQPRKFTTMLQKAKVLFRGSRGALEPYAEYLPHFRIRIVPVGVDDDGRDVTRVQTMVRPEGVQWLARRYAPVCAPTLAVGQVAEVRA